MRVMAVSLKWIKDEVSDIEELCFLSILRWDSKRAKNAVLSILPIIGWMRMYKVKEWLLGDVVSGISTGLVAIMQGREEDMLMMEGKFLFVQQNNQWSDSWAWKQENDKSI